MSENNESEPNYTVLTEILIVIGALTSILIEVLKYPITRALTPLYVRLQTRYRREKAKRAFESYEIHNSDSDSDEDAENSQESEKADKKDFEVETL